MSERIGFPLAFLVAYAMVMGGVFLWFSRLPDERKQLYRGDPGERTVGRRYGLASAAVGIVAILAGGGLSGSTPARSRSFGAWLVVAAVFVLTALFGMLLWSKAMRRRFGPEWWRDTLRSPSPLLPEGSRAAQAYYVGTLLTVVLCAWGATQVARRFVVF
jgi:hypothetical protein